MEDLVDLIATDASASDISDKIKEKLYAKAAEYVDCLLYTSPSPRDGTKSRMPSSA